jgi:hypothetical protein
MFIFDRNNESCARDLIEEILPEPASRRSYLQVLVDSIKTAHSIKPSSWGITLFEEGLVRLNVGMIEVTTCERGEWLRFILDGFSFPEMPDEILDSIDLYVNADGVDLGIYKSVPGSVILKFHSENFSTVLPIFRTSYNSLLQNAAATGRNGSTQKAHSPGVLKYLRNEFKQSIPDPIYPAKTQTSHRSKRQR